MANVPSEQEVKTTLEESQKAEQAKLEAQKAEGKDFVNNGQGVMPEDVWQGLPGKQEAK